MESCKVNLRWRKESLKPIETKRNDREAWLEGIPEEEPLSPSAYLFNEPNFNVHVVAILGTKSRLSLQLIKEKLPHTLLKHPRFSSFQVYIHIYTIFFFSIVTIWSNYLCEFSQLNEI